MAYAFIGIEDDVRPLPRTKECEKPIVFARCPLALRHQESVPNESCYRKVTLARACPSGKALLDVLQARLFDLGQVPKVIHNPLLICVPPLSPTPDGGRKLAETFDAERDQDRQTVESKEGDEKLDITLKKTGTSQKQSRCACNSKCESRSPMAEKLNQFRPIHRGTMPPRPSVVEGGITPRTETLAEGVTLISTRSRRMVSISEVRKKMLSAFRSTHVRFRLS